MLGGSQTLPYVKMIETYGRVLLCGQFLVEFPEMTFGVSKVGGAATPCLIFGRPDKVKPLGGQFIVGGVDVITINARHHSMIDACAD